MGQPGMQLHQVTNDQRHRMALSDENIRMVLGNVSTGISPLHVPPQFNIRLQLLEYPMMDSDILTQDL